MFIAAILSIAGLGFVCWFVFNLAVYALPFFAGMTAGLAAYHHGAGPLGAIMVGLCAGAATLVFGQFLFAHLRSPVLRIAIAVVFAIPAAIAGYHLTHGLSGIGGTAETWREFFSCAGGFVVGGVAWMRMCVHRLVEHDGEVVLASQSHRGHRIANDI